MTVDNPALDGLVQAWRKWDRHPGADHEANRMVDAVHVVARQLGVSSVRLRIMLTDARMTGLHLDDAVRRVVDQLSGHEGPRSAGSPPIS